MKIEEAVYKIQKLKIDRAHGVAPHKPILLLSLFQAIDNSLINENKIFITPELVSLFKTNWATLVTSKHDCRFSLPFYHLSSDGIWIIKPKVGYENFITLKGSMRSFNQLNAAVDYAFFSNEFYYLILSKQNRDILIQVILDTYFAESKTKYNIDNKYFDKLENNVVNENAENYILEIKRLKASISQESFEEEIYIRGGAFKREVPKIYNNTCCISGMRIDSVYNISMIDACHIIPFSESYNDTIGNGIALCPNLHRAFDRGLIGINSEYKVIVSKGFTETNSNYSIKQFEHKPIILPNNKSYYPKIDNLLWHNNNIYRK